MTPDQIEARLHRLACECIAKALNDHVLNYKNGVVDDRILATAIVARLAHLDPPILLATLDQIKD